MELIQQQHEPMTYQEVMDATGLARSTVAKQSGMPNGWFDRVDKGLVSYESVAAYIARRRPRKRSVPKQDKQTARALKQEAPKQDKPAPAAPALTSDRDEVAVTVDEPQPKQRRPRRINDDNDDGKTGSLLETCAPNGCHPDPLTDADKARQQELIQMRNGLQLQMGRGEASLEEVKEEYDAIEAELYGITSQTAKWVKAMYKAHGRTTS